MSDGYDMHVGLNSLRIIFRKNLYEKSGKWIRYAWRVQNFALPMAACISKELCSNSWDFSLTKMQLKSMRRWGKANTYRKKRKTNKEKEKETEENESRKLLLIATHRGHS